MGIFVPHVQPVREASTSKEARGNLEKSVPSIESALDFVSALKEIDLRSVDDSQLENKLFKYFPTLSFNNNQFIPANIELYRARLDEGESPFNSTSDIFVRDKIKITNYGRANRPHDQIFYCSNNLKVAATEIIQHIPENNFWHKKPLATVTVGKWWVKKPLYVSSIFHDSILHSIRKDIKYFHTKYQEKMFELKLSNKVRFVDDILCEFFAKEFTKEVNDENEYKISALYSTLVKGNNPLRNQIGALQFDGLKYPSVATRYIGDNYALFMDSFYSKHLELFEVEQLVCTNLHIDIKNPLVGEWKKAKDIRGNKIIW